MQKKGIAVLDVVC